MVLKRKRGGEFVDWTPASQASTSAQGDPGPRTLLQDAVGPSPPKKTCTSLNLRRSTRSTTSKAVEPTPETTPVKKPRISRTKMGSAASQPATEAPVASSSSLSVPKSKAAVSVPQQDDDWKHDANYVNTTLKNLLLPPFQSSTSASMAIQRELKAMLKEQEMATCLKDLGWYMPPELIGDNLYQWIVEMHSLDPTLPIAKDLERNKINSIIFEIRFPPTYPKSPPFFRIITPRFLPFIQGGGGHVTGGGSICIDLLTSDGWVPSYTISAVLLQIRLALGNLEPQPARLASNWHRPYGVGESLAGYRRAAAAHNWTVPTGLERLLR